MVNWKIVGAGGVGLALGAILAKTILEREVVGTGVIVAPNGDGYPFVAKVYGMGFPETNPERGISRWGVHGNSRADAMYAVASYLKLNPGMVAP